MENTKTYLLFGLAAAFLFSSPSRASVECRPSYVKLAEKVDIRTSPVSEIEYSALLIGCQRDLEALTPEELQRAASALADRARALGSAFDGVLKNKIYRLRAVRAINAAIGRNAASDVFLYDTSLTEYRARKPSPTD